MYKDFIGKYFANILLKLRNILFPNFMCIQNTLHATLKYFFSGRNDNDFKDKISFDDYLHTKNKINTIHFSAQNEIINSILFKKKWFKYDGRNVC